MGIRPVVHANQGPHGSPQVPVRRESGRPTVRSGVAGGVLQRGRERAVGLRVPRRQRESVKQPSENTQGLSYKSALLVFHVRTVHLPSGRRFFLLTDNLYQVCPD